MVLITLAISEGFGEPAIGRVAMPLQFACMKYGSGQIVHGNKNWGPVIHSIVILTR